MGVPVEFNNILALRSVPGKIKDLAEVAKKLNPSAFVPVDLIEGEAYHFSKKGYRIYPLTQEIPLVITQGNCNITEVVALIKILNVSVTPNQEGTDIWTEGLYRIEKKLEEPEKSAWLTFVNGKSETTSGIGVTSQ